MNDSVMFSALPFVQSLGIIALPLIALVLVWIIVIKGIALWKSARNDDKWWFIALLLINSLGILELVYIIWFSKKKMELMETVSAPESK